MKNGKKFSKSLFFVECSEVIVRGEPKIVSQIVVKIRILMLGFHFKIWVQLIRGLYIFYSFTLAYQKPPFRNLIRPIKDLHLKIKFQPIGNLHFEIKLKLIRVLYFWKWYENRYGCFEIFQIHHIFTLEKTNNCWASDLFNHFRKKVEVEKGLAG